MLVVGKLDSLINIGKEEGFKDLDCRRKERNRSIAWSKVRWFARFEEGYNLRCLPNAGYDGIFHAEVENLGKKADGMGSKLFKHDG
jgi:hypothetical protein